VAASQAPAVDISATISGVTTADGRSGAARALFEVSSGRLGQAMFATDYPTLGFDDPSRFLPPASATPKHRSISTMRRSCTGSLTENHALGPRPDVWPGFSEQSCAEKGLMARHVICPVDDLSAGDAKNP